MLTRMAKSQAIAIIKARLPLVALKNATIVEGLSIQRRLQDIKTSARKFSARSVECSKHPNREWWRETRPNWRGEAPKLIRNWNKPR